MIMATKIATNLSLPTEVREEYLALAAELRSKQKWLVATAAMLMFIEAPPEIRDHYMREAAGADVAGASFKNLIARAKSGQLRIDAEERAAEARDDDDDVTPVILPDVNSNEPDGKPRKRQRQ